MYYEEDIKGGRSAFITSRAFEFIVHNELDEDKKRLENVFCWVEFGTVYSKGYSHSFINNANNAIYMIAIHKVFESKGVEAHFIDMKTGEHKVYDIIINNGKAESIERGFF